MNRRKRTDYALILVSTLGSYLFITLTNGPITALEFELIIGLPALLTWTIWHFTAHKITKIVIHGLRRSQSELLNPKNAKQVFQIDVSSITKHRSFLILRKSLLPFVVVLGVSATLLSFLGNFFGIPNEPLSRIVSTSLTGLLILPFISVFVVPITWILDTLGLRVLDEKRKTIEAFRISSFWQNLFGLGTLVSFAYYMFTISSQETVGSDPSTRVGYLIALVLFLYPPALLLTTLYYRYSFSKHLSSVYRSFDNRGVSLSEWPAFRK